MGAGLIEPVGQGVQAPAAPGDPPRRKLRPIGLSEVLVKLGETVILDDLTPKARRVLEPMQMGAGTPDGVAIAVRVLRGWADEMGNAVVHALSHEQEEQHCLSDVIAGTDLENAFGRMYRSADLRAVRTLLPEVLPMLAGRWRNRKVTVWQHVLGKWTKFESARGGWQGSRLTQLAV